jgi:hypothetical protein
MIHVSIQHKQYRNYTQTSNCIITSEAFYRNHLYKDNALIKYTDQQLFAAVDWCAAFPSSMGKKEPISF